MRIFNLKDVAYPQCALSVAPKLKQLFTCSLNVCMLITCGVGLLLCLNVPLFPIYWGHLDYLQKSMGILNARRLLLQLWLIFLVPFGLQETRKDLTISWFIGKLQILCSQRSPMLQYILQRLRIS